MIKVTAHKAVPVEPPETFTLEWLTKEELLSLHAILGQVEAHGSLTKEVFRGIDKMVLDRGWDNFQYRMRITPLQLISVIKIIQKED